MKPPCWTDAETETLRRLWPEATRKEVEVALPGRPWEAIKSKASGLGIRRSRRKASPHAEVALANDRRVFDYVRDHTERIGFGPILTDISKGTGMAHTTVRRVVDRLIERGLLMQNKGRGRMIGISPRLRARMAQRAA